MQCKRFVSSCINNGFWIILSSHQPIISISCWWAHVQLQPHCTSDPLLLAFTSQDNLCSHDQIYSKPPHPQRLMGDFTGLAWRHACSLSVRAASAIHLQIGPRIPTALLILFPQHKCLNGKTDQILRRCSDISQPSLCWTSIFHSWSPIVLGLMTKRFSWINLQVYLWIRPKTKLKPNSQHWQTIGELCAKSYQ